MSGSSPSSDTARTIEAVWRIEAPAVIARLTRLLGNLESAEDLAQDTFVAALKRWPQSGIPDNPGAWLMATARYLAVDQVRRNDTLRTKLAELGTPQDVALVDFDAAVDDVGDDMLRLMFMACHPILSPDARVALTLRVFGGLTTDELARCVPHPRNNGRATHRPREAGLARGARAVRHARRRGPRRARVVGARGHLLDLQRGLRRDER